MGIKRKILMGIIIWFGLAVIACIFIALQPSEKKEDTPAVKQESKAEELPQPAFSKDNSLTEAEKLKNPLIINHCGQMRVITNGMGEGLGYAQVIEVQQDDFEAITGKQLMDFWNECNFDGWQFVYVFECIGRNRTGRGMVITSRGSGARYGLLDTDEDAGTNFGRVIEEYRQFFHLKENNGFQYFNSTDPDDEPLRFLGEEELVFIVN